MYIVNGILLILTGLGAMGFGLMLFAVVGAGAIAMGWQFMNLERWTGAGTIIDTR
jgi:hypothetical protein